MQYDLEKSIWTEQDFDKMGWHDSSVYGIAFGTPYELSFDIDYIFKWVNPVKLGQPISFWVSPCTLLFKDAFALTMNIDRRGGMTDMLEIADLYLVGKVEQEKNKWIYEWNIDLQEGHINFKSSGFDQVIRQRPVFTDGQFLTLDERNGISFSQTPFTI